MAYTYEIISLVPEEQLVMQPPKGRSQWKLNIIGNQRAQALA
jgi:hypothetical protein